MRSINIEKSRGIYILKKIKEVIVVEGKTDTAVLKQLYDVETIETNGSALNDMTIELIKTAAKTRGVIVLTDPDYPGMQIRNKIVNEIPLVKHAFIDKKDAIGKKKLGIAEARKEAIIKALEQCVEFKEYENTLTSSEFIDLDIINNKIRREYLYHYFHLGYGNNKTLFKRLNMVGITKKDILKALEK